MKPLQPLAQLHGLRLGSECVRLAFNRCQPSFLETAMYCYEALVRVQNGWLFKAFIQAESVIAALNLLKAQYGEDNVFGCPQMV